MSRGSAGLEFAFTHYVRSLDSTDEPEPAAFEAAWEKLTRVLMSQLRKRSLSTAPPTFLGIYGYESWSLPKPGAVWELIQDCFTSVLVERLHLLKHLLEKLEHIDGVAFRYIRNFLYDRQKKHDPVGYRVYDVLRLTARQWIEAGELYALDGDPKIRSGTILGIDPENDPRKAAPAARVSEHVEAWCDDLLPELILARGRDLERIKEVLGGHLCRLAKQFEGIRFGDVVKPLKSEVRRRWHTIYRPDEENSAIEEDDVERVKIVRWIRPDPGVEERDTYEKLVACVTEGLAKLKGQQRTQEHLYRLWTFIRNWVAHGEDSLPPNRQLEDLLGIPRKKIPDLLKLLCGLLDGCRQDGRG